MKASARYVLLLVFCLGVATAPLASAAEATPPAAPAAAEAQAPAPQVVVHFAPDQPIPCVFPDEPLVVELVSSADLNAAVELELRSAGAEPVTLDVGAVALRAQSPHWLTVPNAPARRGHYRATVRLRSGEGVTELTGQFCRVDRPPEGMDPPLGFTLGKADPCLLAAAKGVPVRQILLDGAGEGIEQAVLDATKLGFQAGLLLRLESLPDPEARIEALAKALSETAAAWHLDPGARKDLVDPAVRAIRRGGSRAPVALVARNPQALVALMENGAGHPAASLTLATDAPHPLEITLFREVAEQNGYESPSLSTLGLPPLDPPEESGTRLARLVLMNLAAGVSRTYLTIESLCGKQEIVEGYPYLVGLARRFDGAAYVGQLDSTSGDYILVFRKGTGWLLALWTSGEEKELALELGPTANLVLTDALNNPMPAPEAAGEVVKVHLTRAPLYLSGDRGSVLMKMARRMAQIEAKAFLDNELFANQFPPEFLEVFKAVAGITPAPKPVPQPKTTPPAGNKGSFKPVKKSQKADSRKASSSKDEKKENSEAPADAKESEAKEAPQPPPTSSGTDPERDRFFALLRMYPYIEQQWHTGVLSREIAVSAMAALTRIVRQLCILEQERGADFIEPLKDTIAQCREYQTQYLVNSGRNAGRERGEWLLEEVIRRLAEAEALDKEGRSIEAKAVSALAEWRARALEFAADTTPIGARVKTPEPKPEAPPDEQQEKGGETLRLKQRVSK